NNVYKGTPHTCVACHQKDDKHNGQFGTDCGACHKTETWQGAPATWTTVLTMQPFRRSQSRAVRTYRP
ncbi:MAG: hypothetical protein NTX53_15005, partial [candidate division WOR-3 bacterium]|nr:hypothetical protein [candidate division WOR-3 bacterium]